MNKLFETIIRLPRTCWDACLSLFGKNTKQPAARDPREDLRYIVVDLEWNQYPRWVRTPTSREGVVMPHEIIQIGAVKVDGLFRVLDTFSIGVRLQGRRKLSKHVARVIQKTQEEIDQGVDFPVAYARFSDWSADSERFITWGTDDFRVFENNLSYYKMSGLDPENWYDAQMIYAKQIRGDRVQTSLEKAAETLGVEDNLMHHDALNDAYITVGVCGQLEMDRGMEECRTPPPKPKPKNENRMFLQKKFVSAGSEGGFETRALAKQHVSALPVNCPVCGAAMRLEASRVSSGDRWMKMGSCKVHGKHLIRYRVRHKNDGEFAWTRTVYAPDMELETYYRDKLAHSGSTHRRRRGSGSGKKSTGAKEGAARESAQG